jgi:cytochrome P450
VHQAREKSWYARTPYGLAVLRYEEVGKLLRDPRLRQGSAAWPAHNGVSGPFAEWWSAILLNLIGADHARMRRLVTPAFSPKLIASLQPRFQALANELIDGFAKRGSCEFMTEFSEPYAARVITMLLGVEERDWKTIAAWAATLGLALGVTFKRDLDKIEQALAELFDYSVKLIADRRAEPRGDFITQLVQAQEQGDKLSEKELRETVVLLIMGGIETTRNQLGLAVETFARHPSQWALLAEQPELAANAVEEVMRIRPTTTWVTRESMEDLTFQDVFIAKGTTIHMVAEAAGTDPRMFPDPGFDITQKREAHFGFGGGLHYCLGHFIARGDMGEALKLLSKRLKNMTIGEGAVFLPDSGNTGPVTLPLIFDPEA